MIPVAENVHDFSKNGKNFMIILQKSFVAIQNILFVSTFLI